MLAARGVPLDFLRVRGFPFSAEVSAFMRQHDTLFVVDQNRDGQLRTLLVNDTDVEKAKLHSVRHYSGTPLSAVHVVDQVLPVLQPESAAAARFERAPEPPRLQA
jgi:2-oxoglutarate ferredoxin oxidoreductase subunit alpha